MNIREYVDDYMKYYPNRWSWSLHNSMEQSDLYMRTRARRSARNNPYKNNDLLPDFSSIEKDAEQFELCNVSWTDFFGIIWEGKKGIHAMAGAPDYKGSLYYYMPDESYSDDGYCISEKYDAYTDTPPEEIYTKVMWRGVNRWIDTVNVKDVEYKYIVDNHLFKDTRIELIYGEEETICVFDDYREIISGLRTHGKQALINKIFKSMNEHFIKLRDSDNEEIRRFFPEKTAEEMFAEEVQDGTNV